MKLSAVLAFEDFLRGLSPLQVQMEWEPTRASVLDAADYDHHTDELLMALRTGSMVRLEAAVFALEVVA